MPTLLEICGADTPSSVQGTSLAPVLLGHKDTAGENVAYIETTIREGVRTLRHLFYCSRRDRGKFGDEEHLFDVAKDPYQMTDVIADPAYKDVAAELRAKTKAWRERTPSVQLEGGLPQTRPAKR